MRLAIPFIVAVLGFVGFSCGGSSSSSQQTDARPEDDYADSMLLTLDDLPSGWAEKPHSDEESPLEECDLGDAPGKTGGAETGRFANEATAQITQKLGVFTDDDAASEALDRVHAAAECIVRVLNAGELDNAEVRFSDAFVNPLSFPDLADETGTFRIQVHARQPGETESSSPNVWIDGVGIVRGRVATFLIATGAPVPLPTDDLLEIASNAVGKIPQDP